MLQQIYPHLISHHMASNLKMKMVKNLLSQELLYNRSQYPDNTSQDEMSPILRSVSPERVVVARINSHKRRSSTSSQDRYYAGHQSIGMKKSASAEDLNDLRFEKSPRRSLSDTDRYLVRLKPDRNDMEQTDLCDDSDYENGGDGAGNGVDGGYVASEIDEDEELPLDLSMHPDKKRDRTYSGTDSDDSGSPGDAKIGGRAYKKSLMKRYREFY